MIWIPLVLIVLAVFYVVGTYNAFIALRNSGKNAWSDIDVQLKRRHDLVPNLVETVKGYAGHEKTVLEDVTKARAQAVNSGSPQESAEAENMLSGALKTLFAVTENYPQLKADQNFLQLQAQLSEIEDQIQAARQYYNSTVMALNTKLEMFPSNIIGSWFKIERMVFFEITENSERDAPQVKFT